MNIRVKKCFLLVYDSTFTLCGVVNGFDQRNVNFKETDELYSRVGLCSINIMSKLMHVFLSAI